MSICGASLLRLSQSKYLKNFSRAITRTCSLLNHYNTLKVKSSASLKEIKDAYFTLSKKYHPDLHPNDPKAHDRFIKLKEAYEVLSNPASKKQYDTNMSSDGTKKANVPPYTRPYTYPDYSKQSEWVKREEQMRRDAEFEQFRKEYERASNTTTASGFNRYYYRKPHNLSAEEMKQYYENKYQAQYSGSGRVTYFIIGVILFFGILHALTFHPNNEDDQYDYRLGYPGHSRFFHDSMIQEQLRQAERERMRNKHYRNMINIQGTDEQRSERNKSEKVKASS